MSNYNKNKIIAGAVCVGIGVLLIGGYILHKAEHKNPKTESGWEVQYKLHNVYDDDCLKNMPRIEKFRSK